MKRWSEVDTDAGLYEDENGGLVEYEDIKKMADSLKLYEITTEQLLDALDKQKAQLDAVRELADTWEEDESTHSAPYSHYRNGNQCAAELKQALGCRRADCLIERLDRAEKMTADLREALICVMSWAKNWDSPFLQDDEWISVDGRLIKSIMEDLL